MQKYDFKFRKHELDEVSIRSIYESTYNDAISSFIDWVYKNGFIGYFEDKTVIGNPANRSHVSYTDDLTHSSIDVYVLQYVLTDYQSELHETAEIKKTQLYLSDAIDAFIDALKNLEKRGSVKNIVTYKGNLIEFNYKELANPF